MILKVKKLNEKAVLPIKAHASDCGLDLTCTEITTEVGEDGVMSLVYHTGIALEIPTGYAGLMFMRSSVASKSIVLTNAVGVIDSGYRGEILGKFKLNLVTNTVAMPAIYKPGERFAQLVIMPYPEVDTQWSEDLSESDRGDGGYGSTDKQDTIEEPVINEQELAEPQA